MIDTVYKDKDSNKLNAWLKNVWNNYFMNHHELEYTDTWGKKYRLAYHRFYWFWQDRWTVKEQLAKTHWYHWNVCVVFENGGTCEIAHSTTMTWFPKKLMQDTLKTIADTYYQPLEGRNG